MLLVYNGLLVCWNRVMGLRFIGIWKDLGIYWWNWKPEKVFGMLRWFLLICLVVLAGDPPLVVARGGFAGLLPDSSATAYNLALVVSLPNVILWCDVQLTKDGVGICFPDIKLENASNIADVYKNKETSYSVNGLQVRGWFPIDYTFEDLTQVICKYFDLHYLYYYFYFNFYLRLIFCY